MLYGVEITGLADSMLKQARRIAAAACTPSSAGKHTSLVMHALSGHTSTVDPAYMANVAPLRTWALALWDGWAPRQELLDTFVQVRRGINVARDSCWRKVAGPTAAL
eukprot:11079015-Karenia_brevis.AAC.1